MRYHKGRSTTTIEPRRYRARPAAWAAVMLAALATSGCGDLLTLSQSSSTQIEAAGLYVPANAQLIVNGVIADFECAYTRVVTGMGILGDEITNAWGHTANYDYDRRTITPSSPYVGGCGGPQTPGFYTALSTARGVADTAYVELTGWTDAQVPGRSRLLAQSAAYGGYSILMLGEAMCSAAIALGPELSSTQLFQESKQRFDQAVTHAQASGDPQLLHFAYLGRARALRNLGELAAAAQDAATIPPGFVQNVSPDATYLRRQNIVYLHITQNFTGSVPEWIREMTLENGEPDPRVRATDSGRTGTGTAVPVWTPDKYPEVTTPVPVNRWAEAQFIIAEARIAAGDLSGAAAAINAVRSTHTGIPAYSAANKSAAQVLADLLEERRRELYLEGRRFWDVRAFDLPLIPEPGEPYVVGGGLYSDQRCFPLPNIERNRNPNIN